MTDCPECEEIAAAHAEESYGKSDWHRVFTHRRILDIHHGRADEKGRRGPHRVDPYRL
jgi:hypothetical protein